MGVAFATEKLLPLMGQSQGQQHTGRQYLGRPFPSVSLAFINDLFKNQLLTTADILAVAVFRLCPKVMFTKSAGFRKPVGKNFALYSQ